VNIFNEKWSTVLYLKSRLCLYLYYCVFYYIQFFINMIILSELQNILIVLYYIIYDTYVSTFYYVLCIKKNIKTITIVQNETVQKRPRLVYKVNIIF